MFIKKKEKVYFLGMLCCVAITFFFDFFSAFSYSHYLLFPVFCSWPSESQLRLHHNKVQCLRSELALYIS